MENNQSAVTGGKTEEEGFMIDSGVMGKDNKVMVKKIPLKKIKLGKNSRFDVSSEELSGLMQSIKETGLLQPIGVIDHGGHYEVCYGNRRYLAASKLGFSTIPCMVHKSKKKSDVDLKNLTENIQRRNISLQEIGRYIALLQDDGLTSAEVAIRLGVSKAYITTCLLAFNDVPKAYRGDLEVRVGGPMGSKEGPTSPGKISIKTARRIINAKKENKINAKEAKSLFKAAKSDDRFRADQVDNYINAITHGRTDFLEGSKQTRKASVTIFISEKEYDRLHNKYIEKGPFRGISRIAIAILRGEVNETIKVL